MILSHALILHSDLLSEESTWISDLVTNTFDTELIREVFSPVHSELLWKEI